MACMSSVIERRQISDQPDASNRPPADVLDQPVIGRGIRCNHHRAAGEFAVVKSEEKTGAPVDIVFAIHAQGKWSAAKTRKTNKNGSLIPRLAPAAETTGAQGRNIRGESHAE